MPKIWLCGTCPAIIQQYLLLTSFDYLLTFEQFLSHMREQARAQHRLRTLQERRLRTAAVAFP